ncbi:glycosyltransferase family 2 protein [Bradyrhizobium sp. CIAT3101]|uniref:glycosyltransferase family 2 protein n=1 Tax=Bradyrhizobium sp. CIAT3101 TaxID=439387 RepID=UPI0024B1B4E4|nr:glycosyltransferase family 2 protein [Bradyrhizobium sp. CIAT3101]WFU85441.1 glycosyltransferase family 2 protein [Bradyrhizobium sp. CIAT3101]
MGAIQAEVAFIFVVDDKCPEQTGDYVEAHCSDKRVVVLRHPANQGVGGAVMTGYKAAMKAGADIIVKIDGDGQMDPRLIPFFVEPIINGEADYTKGNRFFFLDELRSMPTLRIFGNSILSFCSKVSTGYWTVFDPTNGFTAIHTNVAQLLPFASISKRYFFETDMLFRLNIVRAVVVDIPMDAKYGDEQSNLKISKIIAEFSFKHFRNVVKRIVYTYYLRDLSLASFELPIGLFLMVGGATFGINRWVAGAHLHAAATAGTVMLAALPFLAGLQLILAFLGYDISSAPKRPIHKSLRRAKLLGTETH